MKKVSEDRSSSGSKSGATATFLYLILYNVVQTIGWTALAVITILHGPNWHSNLYDHVALPLNIFQTLALLEIIHAATGLVRSNPLLTGFQVLSRVYLVWGVYHLVPESRTQIGLPLVLAAWCITEIIRYSYYALALVGSIPHILQWLRYTTFIILYPLGVTGELLSVYSSLTFVRLRNILSFTLPNAANISFCYYYALIVIMFTYIPIFPQLYGHMIAQRRKVLGNEDRRKKD